MTLPGQSKARRKRRGDFNNKDKHQEHNNNIRGERDIKYNMWSAPKQRKERKENTMTDVTRNVRYIHMQINTPKIGNKTRASKVKEALMIIFATSKHIKLHPKKAGEGEIITNIDDMVTTEEFTNQYFFDKKIGGKKFIRGEGTVDYYVTKVRLETDIGLNQMKWHTSAKFLDALKSQHIFLKEYQDGIIMRTGNVGWLAGINPSNTSISRVTKDLNRVLQEIDTTAIIDAHTVSIRFTDTKKAFVTRAYKVMSNMDKIDEAREAIQKILNEKNMGVGWEKVELVQFNMDKNTTAMMIEKHNRLLHNTAVIAIKNMWSITEKDRAMTEEEMTRLGLDVGEEEVSTIEEMWWNLANKYKQDVQGMITRRGTLEILTTRKNLNDTVGFARELVNNTIDVIGDERFALLTANHNPIQRKPTIQEAPMILAGRGRVKLDTTHFTEEEFKLFATKHGIPIGDKNEAREVVADLTRPPKAFYHKAGREPVEHDPRTMRDGARKIWEQFTTTTTEQISRKKQKDTEQNAPPEKNTNIAKTPDQMTTEEIMQKGKLIRLENSMKAMKDSQEAMEKSTNQCQKKITNMTKITEDSIDKMSEMIAKMGDSITAQNQQLEVQAKAQVKQAEDIQKIMAAIQVISKAVQITPVTTQDDNAMQIDIAASNFNKRKQTSPGLTTSYTEDNLESIMTQPNKAGSQRGVHNTGRQ